MYNTIDPSHIDHFYSHEDVEGLWESGEDRAEEIELMRRWVPCLTMSNQELYKLLFINGLTQEETASACGISQPSVANRVGSIVRAMRWLKDLPSLTESQISDNLRQLETPEQMVVIYYMSEMSKVRASEHIGKSVRSITKTLRALQYDDNLTGDFKDYLKYLETAPKIVVRLPRHLKTLGSL